LAEAADHGGFFLLEAPRTNARTKPDRSDDADYQ
jgi:hypothetical protein